MPAEDPLTAFGANEWLVDEMYEQYQKDPNSVDPAWWDFFKNYGNGASAPDGAGKATASVAASQPTATRRAGAGPDYDPDCDPGCDPGCHPRPRPGLPRGAPGSSSRSDARSDARPGEPTPREQGGQAGAEGAAEARRRPRPPTSRPTRCCAAPPPARCRTWTSA